MANERSIRVDADLVDMAVAWGMLPDKTPNSPKPQKTRLNKGVPQYKKFLEGIDLGRKGLTGSFEAGTRYGRSKSVVSTRSVVRGERRP